MLKRAIVVDTEKVRGHLDEVVRSTVEATLNQLLDEEADRIAGAGKYERSDARKDTHAGSYQRKLQTKAGEVELTIFDLVRDFLHDEALAGQDKTLERYLRPDLLIIDDMGMKQLPKRSGEYLFEIIMRRYQVRSTMMTSNRPLEPDLPRRGAPLRRCRRGLEHAHARTPQDSVPGTVLGAREVSGIRITEDFNDANAARKVLHHPNARREAHKMPSRSSVSAAAAINAMATDTTLSSVDLRLPKANRTPTVSSAATKTRCKLATAPTGIPNLSVGETEYMTTSVATPRPKRPVAAINLRESAILAMRSPPTKRHRVGTLHRARTGTGNWACRYQGSSAAETAMAWETAWALQVLQDRLVSLYTHSLPVERRRMRPCRDPAHLGRTVLPIECIARDSASTY